MPADKVRNLWGQDFRILSKGLAENDVVVFVEKLMSQHRESLKQADHLASLHELAAMTVEEAERMAASIKEEARKEVEAESARITAEARARADQVLEVAEKEAEAGAARAVSKASSTAREVEGEAEQAAKKQREAADRARAAAFDAELLRKELRERLDGLEEALNALKEAAVSELSTRMPSHYIGKHLYQGVHFLPAFEKLIREIDSQIARDQKQQEPEGPAEDPLAGESA